ncbi:hypothetical protein ASF58_00675 [Methylobacterium sp. Leaf125]|uniref:hypothetical protein n=1 Tax=Methylobacterium sp. Leaf125 TaxID=1736265 RepID=UPI0006FF2994|nr:hypothetical protein [Methylobacterium sp. Leaf125]KQQ47914.1 hypothetical protein ASF58_00675 [Methylobacterium sp. Leaf125]
MPQIWITYDELGAHYGVASDGAREIARARMWSRRRSHDGLTRVKLPSDVALAYMSAFVSEAAVTAAGDLRKRVQASEAARQAAAAGPSAMGRAA